MLGLFGKKLDHPLGELKSAQQLLGEIPKNDALRAVQEITGWIESILEVAGEFRLDHELAVLRLFDEAAQPLVRKLLRDYFAVQPLSKFQENRLWTALQAFYTASERVHYDLLVRCRDGGRGTSALKGDMPLVAVRGIAAAVGRLKMGMVRYALIEPGIWSHLADFYRHAETQGYARNAVPLYPGIPGNTSVAQQLAALLVWYGVSAGVTTPLQAHVMERLVAYAGKGLQLDAQPQAGAFFMFDLAQPTPPMRVLPDPTLHPSLRFVRVEDSRPLFDKALKILEKGVVPEEFGPLGLSYDAEVLQEILCRLTDRLTLPPPTRRNPRRKISVSLNIANGLSGLLEQTDAGLNFTSEANGVIWEVEDVSVTGFRSVVPADRVDGIRIGSLLGSRPENVRHWGAGIVRRLGRDADNNLHVGVEMLSQQVVAVRLTRYTGREDGAQDVEIALYLKRPGDASGEAWLLMKADSFSPSLSFHMEMEGKTYLLLPQGRVESGEDYDLARYRCMEQESATDE